MVGAVLTAATRASQQVEKAPHPAESVVTWRDAIFQLEVHRTMRRVSVFAKARIVMEATVVHFSTHMLYIHAVVRANGPVVICWVHSRTGDDRGVRRCHVVLRKIR